LPRPAGNDILSWMKRWIIVGAVVLAIAGGAVWWMTRPPKPVEKPKVVEALGPDPSHLAKVAELVRKIEDLEQKGRWEEALAALRELSALEPKDSRLETFKSRLEEKLGRLKAWRGIHERALAAKADAARRDAAADWQKVIDLCAEAEKTAPTEDQQRPTRELAALARQNLHWLGARAEEKKGNLAAALGLVARAIAEREPPPELTAYRTALEKKKRKEEYDRAASAARLEAVSVKAFELWKQARALAEDPKDVEEADRRLDLLLPRVDMAERDRRFDAAMTAGEAALAAGELDRAEKAFRDAHSLKNSDPRAGAGLSRIEAARRVRGYDDAMAAAKAAEAKKEWTDAIEAYDRALRMKPGDQAAGSRRKEVEETWRPARMTVVLEPTTGIKMEFVLIPRGAFKMGDARGKPDEAPRDVTIAKDFYMQTTEVTQRQWEYLMRTKPFSFSGSPEVPVEGVSWNEVQKFLEKLNATAKEQMKARKAALPTEVQWEYACRAGKPARYSFGDDEAQLEEYGWFTRNSGKGPQPVGRKLPNAWGLFDMHGNVSEWCQDAYASDPAKAAAAEAIEDSPRSIRGGSWNDRGVNCRSGSRDKDLPTKGSMFVGFRTVLR
jgi:formylglycine-generating enzyme required for sulfatase activity